MQLRDAVTAYFAGEQIEMIAILVGALVLLLTAAVLWLWTRDGFAAGFALTAMAAGLLLGGTAATLLVRDGRSGPALAQAVSAPDVAVPAIAAETARIAVVIGKYPLYRYFAAALLTLALAGLLLTSRGWVHGAAAGLIILAAAQVVIDHYSEQRARRYAERLAAG